MRDVPTSFDYEITAYNMKNYVPTHLSIFLLFLLLHRGFLVSDVCKVNLMVIITQNDAHFL
jgi:hypothetical protein